MRERVRLTSYRAQVTIDGQARPAAVEPDDDALSIAADGEAPLRLDYSDIEDLRDDNYVLRIADWTGRRFDVSMLGKAYGQVLADVSKRRRDKLQHDLLLRGVGVPEAFDAAVFRPGDEPEKAELRLFQDLLVVMPEHSAMWGLPYSFVERVEWDPDGYHVRVVDDEGGVNVFGWLAKRTEEFRDNLQARMDALRRRTARTLGALLPGVEQPALEALADLMRDGRAVQQWRVDAVEPSLWAKLEDAVVGAEGRRESYEALKARTPSGWAALGIKAVGAEKEGPAEEPAAEPPQTRMWFFCPLGVNAVAQEVTSEESHATYLFRLMEPPAFSRLAGQDLAVAVARSIARLNRALLALNLRREPIYLPEERLSAGEDSRYRVALRKLPYLRDARAAFLGRAAHTSADAWRRQVDEALARA